MDRPRGVAALHLVRERMRDVVEAQAGPLVAYSEQASVCGHIKLYVVTAIPAQKERPGVLSGVMYRMWYGSGESVQAAYHDCRNKISTGKVAVESEIPRPSGLPISESAQVVECSDAEHEALMAEIRAEEAAW